MQKENLEWKLREKQEAIDKLYAQIDKNNDDNEILKETIARMHEKINSVREELEERQRQYQNLTKRKQNLQARAHNKEEGEGEQDEQEDEEEEDINQNKNQFNAKEFEMQIKEQLHDLIQEKVEALKKLRKEVFKSEQKEKEVDQMFVNAVQIKLFLDPETKEKYDLRPVNEFGQEAKFITQSFRISRETNFGQLMNAASKYWGIGKGYIFEIEESAGTKKQKIEPELEVQKFFEKNREIFTEAKAVLIMQRQNLSQQQIEDSTRKNQEDAATIRAKKKLQKAKNAEKKDKKNKPEQQILQRLPGLKPFYNLAKAKKMREEETKHLRSWRTNFYVLLLFLTFFILNLINIVYRRDIKQEFWAIATMEDKIGFYTNANSIDNHQDLYTWLDNAIYIHLRAQFSPINAFNKPIGMFRVRSYRSSEVPCQVPISGYKCYTNAFDESHIEKSTLVPTSSSTHTDWINYRNYGSPKVSSVLTSYPAGGYVQDIDSHSLAQGNYTSDSSALLNPQDSVIINSLKPGNFLHQSTKSVIFSFNYYNPINDLYIAINIIFEFEGTTEKPIIGRESHAYRPNTLELPRDYLLLIGDCIRLIIISIFLIIVIYEILQNFKATKRCSIVSILKSGCGIFTMFSLFLAYFILIYSNLSPNPKDIVTTTSGYGQNHSFQFYDLTSVGQKFSTALLIDAFLVIFVIYNIINVLRISKHPHVMMTTLENAMKQVLVYMCIIVPFLIGFAIVGWKLWGSYVWEYSTFNKSLLSTLLLLIGITKRNDLEQASLIGTVIYMGIFFILMIYFALSVFLAIYSDSLRITLLHLGYPSMQKQKDKWGYRQYMLWFCSICPRKCKKRFREEKKEDD